MSIQPGEFPLVFILVQVCFWQTELFFVWLCHYLTPIFKRYILLNIKFQFDNIFLSALKICHLIVFCLPVFHKLANIPIIISLYIMCHFSPRCFRISFFIFHFQEFDYDVTSCGFCVILIMCRIHRASLIWFSLNMGNFSPLKHFLSCPMLHLSVWDCSLTCVATECLLLSH